MWAEPKKPPKKKPQKEEEPQQMEARSMRRRWEHPAKMSYVMSMLIEPGVGLQQSWSYANCFQTFFDMIFTVDLYI